MNTCVHCEKKITDRYRVNEFGDTFYLDGWFFCDSCQSYFPGFFTKEELLHEIHLYETRPTKSEFYTRKVKRSCRYHDVELPDWV